MTRGQSKRILLFAALALAVAVALVPLEVLAWFAINDTDNVGGVHLAVDDGYGVSLTLSFNGVTQVGEENSILLMPGDFIVGEVLVKNVGEDTANVRLNLDSLSVRYPTRTAGFNYSPSLYLTDDYYDGNTWLDPEEFVTESVFKSFVAPVTNALLYDLYYVSGASFSENYVQKYLSDAPNASSADLTSATGVSVTPTATALPISALKTNGSETTVANGVQIATGALLNADGTLTLDGDSEITLYMVLYFDPQKTTHASVTLNSQPTDVTLRNSNGYSEQHFSIRVSVVTV